MTQAPTPGPLLHGDIVRGPNGQIETVKSANPDFLVLKSGNGYLPSLVTFIGRPDADGWIEAPDGGWAGNPVAPMHIITRRRGGHQSGHIPHLDDNKWKWTGTGPDIIAFRLAPTAPVEASGSERSDIELVRWLGHVAAQDHNSVKLAEPEEISGYAKVVSSKELARLVRLADRGIRLKLSGETRDSAIRIVMADLWNREQHTGVGPDYENYRKGATWDMGGRVEQYEAQAARIVDALAALRPQPSGETREAVAWIDPTDIDHVAEGHPLTTTLFPYAKDGVTMPLYTTPARAEAQDDDATRLKLAICGGEDVPGAINAVSVEDCERFLAEERRLHSRCAERLAEIDAFQSDKIDVLRVLLGDSVSVSPGSAAQDALKWAIDRIAKAEALDEGAAGERPYPKLLNKEESKALLALAEELWSDLQANNLGGFSDANRPFYILNRFKGVIEQFGHRDIGQTWSKNQLDAHPSPTPAADADRVRIAVEALEDISTNNVNPSANEAGLIGRLRERATKALAALKSTAAKEGGSK